MTVVVRTPDAATAACTSLKKAAWLVTASPYGASAAKSTPCCASEGDATIGGVKGGFKAGVGLCGAWWPAALVMPSCATSKRLVPVSARGRKA